MVSLVKNIVKLNFNSDNVISTVMLVFVNQIIVPLLHGVCLFMC